MLVLLVILVRFVPAAVARLSQAGLGVAASLRAAAVARLSQAGNGASPPTHVYTVFTQRFGVMR